MQYFAIVNTADPRIGLVTVGEKLTEKQAEALGEEKLNELVERGVLKAVRDIPDAPAPKDAVTGAEAPATEPDEEEDPMDGEKEDLPELEIDDDLVKDETEEAPTQPKARARKEKRAQ